jgi:hypothetical protein
MRGNTKNIKSALLKSALLKSALLKSVLFLACLPGLAALVTDGIQVKITNDSVQDILLTVHDMNTQPQRILLQNARLNGFTSVLANAFPDATGRANLLWTATSTDALSPKCGHGESRGLANNSEINVHADSDCTV